MGTSPGHLPGGSPCSPKTLLPTHRGSSKPSPPRHIPPPKMSCPPTHTSLAPHTHGIHHVDVIHKIPLSQVDGELWGGMGGQSGMPRAAPRAPMAGSVLAELRGVSWGPPVWSPPTGVHHPHGPHVAPHPCSTQKPAPPAPSPGLRQSLDLPQCPQTWWHLEALGIWGHLG